MDLRWGLREESQDNHTVIEFCIQEIENCAQMSLGPSFVVCRLLLVAFILRDTLKLGGFQQKGHLA